MLISWRDNSSRVYHLQNDTTTDRSTLLWRIFSVFNFASWRSSAFFNFIRFRSLSVFLFSRRTGGLCDTFVDAISLSSLSAPSASGLAHSFNHVIWTEQEYIQPLTHQQVFHSNLLCQRSVNFLGWIPLNHEHQLPQNLAAVSVFCILTIH